jgi:low molecular weight phosphotyrosine protein phosphatase
LDLQKKKVRMFGEFGDGKAIQDPYYGASNGFETTYKQVLAYSEAFLEYVKENHPISQGQSQDKP